MKQKIRNLLFRGQKLQLSLTKVEIIFGKAESIQEYGELGELFVYENFAIVYSKEFKGIAKIMLKGAWNYELYEPLDPEFWKEEFWGYNCKEKLNEVFGITTIPEYIIKLIEILEKAQQNIDGMKTY